MATVFDTVCDNSENSGFTVKVVVPTDVIALDEAVSTAFALNVMAPMSLASVGRVKDIVFVVSTSEIISLNITLLDIAFMTRKLYVYGLVPPARLMVNNSVWPWSAIALEAVSEDSENAGLTVTVSTAEQTEFAGTEAESVTLTLYPIVELGETMIELSTCPAISAWHAVPVNQLYVYASLEFRVPPDTPEAARVTLCPLSMLGDEGEMVGVPVKAVFTPKITVREFTVVG